MTIELLGLFSVALLSATLIPLQSELVFLTMAASGHYPHAALLVAASAGNIAGSCINWWLGKCLLRFQSKRWFPFKPQQIDRATQQFQRYGEWSLLLSWAPIIGDPLTLIAGILRVPFWRFLLWVSVAKSGRYLFLLGAWQLI